MAAVGSKVLAKGRAGEVLIYDAEDPAMTYKVRFEDGTADWFKKDEVCLDGTAAPVDEEELKRKAAEAAEEMEALKAKQLEQKRAADAEIAKAMKALDEDKALRQKPLYREKTYTDAEAPAQKKPEAEVGSAIKEDNEVF
mmetsp:Transcript_70088/g.124783  ORF Transcript_70088/g.124783 Transcript_70088/m.124783 type:complete len:140 (-) Transcript_70088:60-479(-)